MSTITLKCRFARFIRNYMKRLSLGLVVNLAIILVIGLFNNKTQIQSYIDITYYVGGANIALGAGSIFGNSGMRGNLGYQYSRVSGSESQIKRIREDMNSTEKAFNYTVFMGILGGTLFLISAALQWLV